MSAMGPHGEVDGVDVRDFIPQQEAARDQPRAAYFNAKATAAARRKELAATIAELASAVHSARAPPPGGRASSPFGRRLGSLELPWASNIGAPSICPAPLAPTREIVRQMMSAAPDLAAPAPGRLTERRSWPPPHKSRLR
jgi:hypothetical protein